MRAITKDAVAAFYAGRNFKRSNTEVCSHHLYDGMTYLYLHGNCIAKRDSRGVFVRHAGWRTLTTKERLNGILQHYDKYVRQKDGEWLLGCHDPFTTAVVELSFDDLADGGGWVRADR